MFQAAQQYQLPVYREDVRRPCATCGHTVFLELLRAPRGTMGKDAPDRERCERCGNTRVV